MKQIKIVVTGGPSGGKTTLLEMLKKELGQQAVLVPESASILYRGGFPRLKEKKSAIKIQRAIYYVQKELEQMLAEAHKKSKVIVCDRGSLDGIAYWPNTEKNFFSSLKSTRKKELARYDWVLHLDTASRAFYDQTNPLRTETHSQATELNEKIKRAWREHPRRFIIPQTDDFLSKVSLAFNLIHGIMKGLTPAELESLNQVI